MTTSLAPRHSDAERAQHRAQAEMSLRDQIRWLMGDAIGRALAWRLLDSSRVLQRSLANNTATIQSGIVAVRDFAMEQLLDPILEHCPELFLQAKAEHERRETRK